MGNKLTPKVILEGTRLTFKTEIAFELNEHPRVVSPHKYRYLGSNFPPRTELAKAPSRFVSYDCWRDLSCELERAD